MANLKLTPAEWEIMEAIWKSEQSVSVREIVDSKYPNGEKAYTTIQTLMNILVKKKMLKARKQGLVNFYQPLKSRDEIVKTEMNSTMSRLFHNSVPALTNYLFESSKISPEEIEQIKQLIEKHENENSEQ